MRRCGNHEHDTVAGVERAVTVNNQYVLEVPALTRFCFQPGELLFCHAGIVLQGHGADFLVTGIVADQSDKTGEPAYLGITCRHLADLCADIEVFCLYADHGDQPPVMGGKTATSSPSVISASSCAISWLTATRSEVESSNAVA